MKRFLLAVGLLSLTGIFYYFFLKPYEYAVSFKTKTLPGDVIETIRIWNKSLNESKILEVDSFNYLIQAIPLHGNAYIYDWRFRLKDSITHVQIRVSEPGNSKRNKFLIPFLKLDIERDAEELSREFFGILNQHLEITKVMIKGESETDSSYCFCKRVKTTQTDKANAMMYEYPLINGVVESVRIKVAGAPSLRIVKWSHSENILEYDFCFPVEKPDSLVQVESFEYKKFERINAIKAIYNGNYITSDRAWYELIHYARANDYKITGFPIEYFIDNPNYGSDELNWRAEIYLPVEIRD